MKSKLMLVVLSLAVGVQGCGGSASAPGTSSSSGRHNSYSVADVVNLPTCDDSHQSELWYVESTSSFQVCKSSGWTDVSLTGLKISSNKLMSSYAPNLCTQYSPIESCHFRGGQVVRFNDGTVMFSGGFEFYAYDSSSHDSDSNSATATMIVPANSIGGAVELSQLVARGNGYKRLYMVYVRSSDSFGLWYDTNGNSQVDSGDTLIATLTESVFP